jgi:2-dehydro-3-deoxyphosphogluconate aldolase/(4S)-4-hydroxy-2-oxoglutarate aldolase
MMSMQNKELFQQITALGIIPVIAIDNPEAALPLADALLAGGLPIVEITFRTAAAAQVIQTIARERPHLLVGAGTVLTRENLLAARAAGARFAVAPGLNPDIVAQAAELGLPFIPGVATPSDIERALALGCALLKFFPAGLLGGLEMIQALAAPYGHTGIKFVPTGGVNPANLQAYLACGAVGAVGGTWLAKKEDLTSGRWAEITTRCRAAVEVVRQARAKG